MCMLPTHCQPTIRAISLEFDKFLYCGGRRILRSMLRKSYGPPESGVAPANQTEERSVHELFTGAFRNKSSM